MKDRLFFDWIDMLSDYTAINKANYCIATTSPYTTHTLLSVSKNTTMRTDRTLQSTILSQYAQGEVSIDWLLGITFIHKNLKDFLKYAYFTQFHLSSMSI